MHETSLMRSLLRQVDEVLDQHRGVAVKEIAIEIGPLSGVEADLVTSAFEQLIPSTRFSGATLNIQFTDLTVRCQQCESLSEIRDFVFRCDECGCSRVQVISGDQVLLKTVTIEEPDEEKAIEEQLNQENARGIAYDSGLATGAQHG